MNKSKDGNHFWVDAVIIPMPGEDGTIVRYLSLKTLIADKMKMRLETEKSFFLLYEVLTNTIDNMSLPLAECIKQIDYHEKKGVAGIKPEEAAVLFTYFRQSTDELKAFRATISNLILSRAKRNN
jgi:hypothetical protein